MSPRNPERPSSVPNLLLLLSSRLLPLLLLPLLLPHPTSAALFPKGSKVVQLNPSNFDSEVLSIEKPTLVAFTAPWCGHCKKLQPEYDKAASQLDGIVKFANVDCDGHRSLCESYQVRGFPTLKMFPATKKRLPKDYQGERVAKALVEYAVDSLPMSVRKVEAEELEAYLSKEPQRPRLILFSTKPKSSALYRSLALDFRRQGISFALMRGDRASVRGSVRNHLGFELKLDDLPLLVIVPSRPDGGKVEQASVVKYPGKIQYHSLKRWIEENVPEASAKPDKKRKVDEATTKQGKAGEDHQKKKRKKEQAKKEKKEDEEEEVKIPPGGQVEWKLRNAQEEREKEKDRLAKVQEVADMLNKAAEKRSKSKAQQQQGSDKDKKGAKEEEEEEERRGDDVKEKVLKAADAVSSAAESISSSASKVYESTMDKIQETADVFEEAIQRILPGGKDRHAGDEKGKEGKRTEGGSQQQQQLKQTLLSWLSGEDIDWESKHGKEFSEAQKAAEKLARENPALAREIGEKGEEWLLDNLRTDLLIMERVKGKVGNGEEVVDEAQLEKVRTMVAEIEARLASKGEGKDERLHWSGEDLKVGGGGKKAHVEL
ncbi:thioredoxin-domain-containing protein [Violaceomyces palustris]|uniref:Thioredoxin-domain-containing protein n=1 Tax=Violaceomyces palustris TaxID=1673888 RepID=A0ACD0NYA7_9BASI|nr:thioredoxin-domain-containing protein [Violaceomyces palustris]